MTCARCGKVIQRDPDAPLGYVHATRRERCPDGRGYAHPTDPDARRTGHVDPPRFRP